MSEHKRRLIRIHLSTAIILMFVASGLLWANLRPTTEYPGHSLVKFFGPGWPRPIFETWVDLGQEGTIPPNSWWNGDWNSLLIALLVNGLTGLFIFLIVAATVEALIRRRASES